MQRGFTVTASMKLKPLWQPCDGLDMALHAEPWIAQPLVVAGTSAEALEPAIASGQPRSTSFLYLDLLQADAKAVDSITMSKVMDKGSGGMLWAKFIVGFFETEVQPGIGNLLLDVDTCSSHLHNRGKLEVKELKTHTLRLHGAAKLVKYSRIQDEMISYVETVAPRTMRRLRSRPLTMPT